MGLARSLRGADPGRSELERPRRKAGAAAEPRSGEAGPLEGRLAVVGLRAGTVRYGHHAPRGHEWPGCRRRTQGSRNEALAEKRLPAPARKILWLEHFRGGGDSDLIQRWIKSPCSSCILRALPLVGTSHTC